VTIVAGVTMISTGGGQGHGRPDDRHVRDKPRRRVAQISPVRPVTEDGPVDVLLTRANSESDGCGRPDLFWDGEAESTDRPAELGERRLVLHSDGLPEPWCNRILSNLGVARWLQASWKLSRALGIANVAVLHRISDLRAVGASDSEQVGLAEGLLADSETRVVYAQSPGEVERTGELLGLTATEAALVTQLRRGLALWKVGRRSFLVEHRLASSERELIDTDAAMIGEPRAD
jgi:hypothetical protein